MRNEVNKRIIVYIGVWRCMVLGSYEGKIGLFGLWENLIIIFFILII